MLFRSNAMKPCGSYYRSLYLNGHGQFLSMELYDEINGVPEKVITDGIQIGYRLSLIGEPIGTIPAFCSDDVPNKISSIIHQHRRWYAGSIQYQEAFSWAKIYTKRKFSKCSYWENVLVNFTWAFRLPIVVGYALYLLFHLKRYFYVFIIFVICIVMYNLVIPIIAHGIQKNQFLKIRVWDWLALPISIGLKSIGPITLLGELLFFGKRYAQHFQKGQH